MASAGFPMPMYTSAVGREQKADAFLVHRRSEALRTAVILVGDMGAWQGPIWNTWSPEPANPPA